VTVVRVRHCPTGREQFSHLNDKEILTLYEYLKDGWSQEQAMEEEKKNPQHYKFEKEDVE